MPLEANKGDLNGNQSVDATEANKGDLNGTKGRSAKPKSLAED